MKEICVAKIEQRQAVTTAIAAASPRPASMISAGDQAGGGVIRQYQKLVATGDGYAPLAQAGWQWP